MSSTWPMAEMIGYTPVTTFWDDFTIAEAFGGNAVRDTFNRAFDEWKGNYKYLTELVMVLNHKIWQHADHSLADIYNELWENAYDYGMCNLKDDELQYFLRVLD